MDFSHIRVSKKEYRWVIVYAATVMLILTLPYVIGYAIEGDSWKFTGFIYGVEDGNSYIAKMLSGAAGNWLFYTPYTAFPQNGVLAFLPYILLGKLSSPPGQHIQLVVIFHLFRIIAGILSIIATYDFLSIYLMHIKWRRFGTILVSLGGGLGWLMVVFGESRFLGTLPLEFYSPESFGFLALFGIPHLALARALLLWGIRFYIIGDNKAKEINSEINKHRISLAGIKAGLLFLSVGLIQPLTTVIAWVILSTHLLVLVLWQVIRKRKELSTDLSQIKIYFSRLFWLISISAPIVIYTAVMFYSDPFLIGWSAQNLILSPNPIQYMLAYGLLLPFVIGGGYFLLQYEAWSGLFPIVWVVLLPFLVYAPYNLQRRLAEGVWVAIIVLTMKAIEGPINSSLSPLWEKIFLYFKRLQPLLIFSLFSCLFIYIGGLRVVVDPKEPLFRPNSEVVAFEYLGSIAHTGDVVISAYDTGNAMPAWIPVRVAIGHGPESVKFQYFNQLVRDFYDNRTPTRDRLAIADQLDATFVFWGPNERDLGAFNPQEESFLSELYDKNGYSIYQILH